jgi:hypothetical protein
MPRHGTSEIDRDAAAVAVLTPLHIHSPAPHSDDEHLLCLDFQDWPGDSKNI